MNNYQQQMPFVETAEQPAQVAQVAQQASPMTGGVGSMGGTQPMDKYTQMANSLMGRNSQMSNSSMGFGTNMRDMAKFAQTPMGRTAIQGAIDAVIAKRKTGLTAELNPYKHIVAALQASMRSRPPTA